MAPVLDVTIPVHNGAAELYARVSRLHAQLSARLADPFRITIIDCASSDATALFALDLAADLPDIAVVRLIEPGFDNAVEHVRLTSDARTVVFVDLSADLRDQLAQVESAGR